MMRSAEKINQFLTSAQHDKRVTVRHIALYAALVLSQEAAGGQNPFPVKRRQLMCLAHIRALPTYHKYLGELVSLGLIRYEASYDRYTGSRVWLGDEITRLE